MFIDSENNAFLKKLMMFCIAGLNCPAGFATAEIYSYIPVYYNLEYDHSLKIYILKHWYDVAWFFKYSRNFFGRGTKERAVILKTVYPTFDI